jgi:hypothetical protein
MNKYVLATNVGVILILISCLVSSASAQPLTQSANTSMSGPNNATTSIGSTNMTIGQAERALCFIQGPGPVCITSTITLPIISLVQVNDAFGFQVGVFNDSPSPITVGTLCQAPITAIFDNHYVTVYHQFCNIFGPPRIIPPHSDAVVYGPPYTQIYKAIRTTNHTLAVLTFTYHTTTGIHHIYWPYAFSIRPHT